MLIGLRIQNFALIDNLELELSPGLNVLTGETGAGKSIILDAIDASLGGKVSSRFVRTGSQKAIVEAAFSLTPAVKQWLQEQEIDLIDEEAAICSREMSVGRSNSLRSRSRVNGVLVNKELIAQLRPLLVEITAQGQTVDLMQSSRQRQLLDLYGGEELRQQQGNVAKVYASYQEVKKALQKRRQGEQQRLQQLDWLQYQMQELEAAALEDPEELVNLEQERDRLLHVVELQQLSYQTYQALYQNDSEEPAAADILASAEALLEDMVRFDAQLTPILEIVQGAINQVVEAGQQINAYGESLEADPERLEALDSRLRTLKQICRKYGPTLAEAIARAEEVQAELEALTDSTQSVEELEKRETQTFTELKQACDKLTYLREIAARRLEGQLIGELKPLAMEKVQFQCEVTPIAPTAQGQDRVVFNFSPNPGEALKPLSETASGGEMSRFLLALKACFSASEDQANTLVFDEIDTGVSGRVASAIGNKLHRLARDCAPRTGRANRQVLCVTHQPLVAALADAHYRVEKQIMEVQEEETLKTRTVVRVSVLDNHQTRKEELAQLAGGDTDREAIAFAESLLIQATNQRQQNDFEL